MTVLQYEIYMRPFDSLVPMIIAYDVISNYRPVKIMHDVFDNDQVLGNRHHIFVNTKGKVIVTKFDTGKSFLHENIICFSVRSNGATVWDLIKTERFINDPPEKIWHFNQDKIMTHLGLERHNDKCI